MASSRIYYVVCRRTGRYLSMRSGYARWVSRQYAQLFTQADARFLVRSQDLWRGGVPYATTAATAPQKPDMRPRLVRGGEVLAWART